MSMVASTLAAAYIIQSAWQQCLTRGLAVDVSAPAVGRFHADEHAERVAWGRGGG